MCTSTDFLGLALKHVIVHSCGALCTTVVHDFYLLRLACSVFVSVSEFMLLIFRLSHLIAVRQGVCYSYLTSSCDYALFSFLKRRGKDQTDKKLTSQLLIDSWASLHTELTSPTLRVPTCPFATFSCFRLYHHPQTQQKSTVLTSSKVSQQEVPLMGGTISHIAVTKIYTQNILHSDGNILLLV